MTEFVYIAPVLALMIYMCLEINNLIEIKQAVTIGARNGAEGFHENDDQTLPDNPDMAAKLSNLINTMQGGSSPKVATPNVESAFQKRDFEGMYRVRTKDEPAGWDFTDPSLIANGSWTFKRYSQFLDLLVAAEDPNSVTRVPGVILQFLRRDLSASPAGFPVMFNDTDKTLRVMMGAALTEDSSLWRSGINVALRSLGKRPLEEDFEQRPSIYATHYTDTEAGYHPPGGLYTTFLALLAGSTPGGNKWAAGRGSGFSGTCMWNYRATNRCDYGSNIYSSTISSFAGLLLFINAAAYVPPGTVAKIALEVAKAFAEPAINRIISEVTKPMLDNINVNLKGKLADVAGNLPGDLGLPDITEQLPNVLYDAFNFDIGMKKPDFLADFSSQFSTEYSNLGGNVSEPARDLFKDIGGGFR